jgi:aspartate ammonia-lyase
MDFRIESDLLGEARIPKDVYWGIHTFRAITNFKLSGQSVSMQLVRALAEVKKACCETNRELGYLDQTVADAISTACDEIISGEWADQFPVDALQGGAGTSTNMNINEVIANRALELMGFEKGDYSHCHPLEHVNLHQSTNDVYPTALKIAAIEGVKLLSDAIASLQGELQCKEKQWASIVTTGRTELQDAVPITLGSQFASFADAVARDRWRTFKCEERLRVVNIGGTAVGTGLAAPRKYIFLVNEKLRQITGYGITRGENLMDQTANADVFVEVSGILSAYSSTLIKVCNDLRVLHFLKEISIPAFQAGSSVMPGKVNPVILEAVISSGIQVESNHTTIANCASRGTFQINEFLPLITMALLQSLNLLTNASKSLAKMVAVTEANPQVCNSHAFESTTLITAFLPYLGYRKAEELVLEFTGSSQKDFRSFLEDRLGVQMVNKVLSPAALMSLGYKENIEREIKEQHEHNS